MSTNHFNDNNEPEAHSSADVSQKSTPADAGDFDQLKSGGFIKQKQKDLFTIRLQVPGGRMPLDKLRKAIEAAEKYSSADYLHLSIRQSVEIPYVNYRDIPALQMHLNQADQAIASCGHRVRVPTACSGCEYNPNGLVDTQKLASRAHEQFFGQDTPHKFKMNFSGCPIDCARSSEADLGFQGAVEPEWDEDSCVACTICEKACKENAIHCDDEGKPVYNPGNCLACADCIRNCPTGAWRSRRTGLIVRVGGKHGRHPLNASVVAEFLPEERVPQVIQGTVQWYLANRPDNEKLRLGDLLRRTGMQSYMQSMAEVFGECAVKEPQPPAPVIIHRNGDKRI